MINSIQSNYYNQTATQSTAGKTAGNFVAANSFSSQLTNAVNQTQKSLSTGSSSMDDIFERAAKKNNVPVNLLKAVAKVESGFDADAVSSCGAMGVMQLMPSTAKSLGITNPYDAEQNIMGGARYLGQLLARYDGNSSLALAAYNAGSGNVAKYGGIPPFKETQNYVARVLKYAGGEISIPQNAQTYSSNNLSDAGQLSSLDSLTSLYSSLSGLNGSSDSSNNYINMLQLLIAEMQVKSSSLSNYDTAGIADVIDTSDDSDISGLGSVSDAGGSNLNMIQSMLDLMGSDSSGISDIAGSSGLSGLSAGSSSSANYGLL